MENDLGYLSRYSNGLSGLTIGVRFPAGIHIVQTSSGAHPASYTGDTKSFFPGSKEAGT
jgi:hypothetical protein